MKRLKMYLSVRDTNVTYKEMYEGKIHIIPKDPEVKAYDLSEPIYWKNGIFYEVSRSNRIELTKPTITIGIPIKKQKSQKRLSMEFQRFHKREFPQRITV